MRYANNKIGGIINGVIFYFEEGDEEIATDVFELVEVSARPPTSIAWNGECMSPIEALHQLQTLGLKEGDWIGVRLTIDDKHLLRECLELFKESYPTLSPMIAEVEGNIFNTKH